MSLTFTTLYGDIVAGTFDETESSPLAVIEVDFAKAFAQYNEIRIECMAGRVPKQLYTKGQQVSTFVTDMTTLLNDPKISWSDLTFYAEAV
jgi:hypothetical protein